VATPNAPGNGPALDMAEYYDSIRALFPDAGSRLQSFLYLVTPDLVLLLDLIHHRQSSY